MVLFLDSQFSPIDLCISPYAITTIWITLSCSTFWNRKHKSPTLIFSFKKGPFLGDFNFNMNFRVNWSIFAKNDSWDFFLLEITFNLSVNFRYIAILMNFPGGSDGKNICLQCGRPGFKPWVGKIPWRRKWQPTPVFLPGKSHGRMSLAGYSPWGFKELDTTERLHFCHFNNIKSSCLWLCDAFLFI